jgi:hypothetical protein
MRNPYKCFWKNPNGRHQLEDVRLDGNINEMGSEAVEQIRWHMV